MQLRTAPMSFQTTAYDMEPIGLGATCISPTTGQAGPCTSDPVAIVAPLVTPINGNANGRGSRAYAGAFLDNSGNVILPTSDGMGYYSIDTSGNVTPVTGVLPTAAADATGGNTTTAQLTVASGIQGGTITPPPMTGVVASGSSTVTSAGGVTTPPATTSWFTSNTIFSSVPNWAVLAGAAALFFLVKD